MDATRSASGEDAARVRKILEDSARVKRALAEQGAAEIAAAAAILVGTFRAGGKLLLFGNGGSAADAQHLAAELTGRFRRERAALPAIALTANTSDLSALGNDYGFEHVFSRLVAAHGRGGDAALAISTSGKSPNVLEAVREARKLGMRTIGLTGRGGGELAPPWTWPSSCPPRTPSASRNPTSPWPHPLRARGGLRGTRLAAALVEAAEARR
jgi:D-sedoheptulose 7-phosphate isomerase